VISTRLIGKERKKPKREKTKQREKKTKERKNQREKFSMIF